MLRDFTDDEARRAIICKWGQVDDDVIPAWVAEMDYALAPVIEQALVAAVRLGGAGYPAADDGGELGRAYAGFAARHFGQQVDPEWVLPTVDVTAGVRLALNVLSEPGPMVMPVPAYAPQLDIAQLADRERVDLVLDPDAERAEIDLDRLASLFESGARTLLLTQPHNPWGRVFTRAELEGVRDVVVAHGARVISDEIHAPLVLPGAEHISYLSLGGHRGARHRARRREQGVQHRGPQVRADHRARRGHPEGAARRARGRERLVVAAGRGGRGGGVHARRPVAGRARRAARPAAHPARRAARGAPPGGPDASAGGHLPGLARPAGLRPRRPGRRGARPAAG